MSRVLGGQRGRGGTCGVSAPSGSVTAMATPHPSNPDSSRDDYHPTKAELETDVSIDADFDDVMQAVIDGHGTQSNTRPQA